MRSGEVPVTVKRYFAVPAICILCIASIMVAGCTGKDQIIMPEKTPLPSPSGTAVQVGHLVITEEQNNATVSVNQGNTITLKLPENPTTGFQWNLTTTPGLTITGDRYVPSDKTGTLVGSGGTHIWEIAATGTGTQEVSAIYKRSWEPITGNETMFGITFMVR
ncbi:MAG TPA: protease inhibitor I42 family protein [Methanoregulaceae archaeon]|nr:protease inhibitor I42 family protein [Methanoregulaceae archaeon]